VCFALPRSLRASAAQLLVTVSDPAGAVVPAAAVNAKEHRTGATYDTVATATGNYTLNSLPPGLYDVTVSAAGFSKSVEQGLRVNVAMTIRVDVILKIGSATESITITGGAEMLRTESAEQKPDHQRAHHQHHSLSTSASLPAAIFPQSRSRS